MLTKDNGFFKWEKGDQVPFSNASEKLPALSFFGSEEFTCPCKNPECKEQLISCELIDKLDEIRLGLGKPVKIDSGYRCHAHQLELAARGAEVAKGVSQHELGKAADIRCLGSLYDFATMLDLAEKNFAAIGEGHNWLHVDLRSDKTRRWFYRN